MKCAGGHRKRLDRQAGTNGLTSSSQGQYPSSGNATDVKNYPLLGGISSVEENDFMSRETPLRVMVVEDSMDFLSSVLAMLAMEPKVQLVGAVISGEAVLQKLGELQPEELQPHLILLDYRLPGLNGLEVAKRIKTGWPNIKVVLLTAYAEELLSMESLPALLRETNVIDLIPKVGFSAKRIIDLVKSI